MIICLTASLADKRQEFVVVELGGEIFLHDGDSAREKPAMGLEMFVHS